MRSVVGVLVAVALAGSAWGWEAKPHAVTYEGSKEFFDSFSYDTGWVPHDTAIQVRLVLEGGSGWNATLTGRGTLSWPEPVELRMIGDPGGGLFTMDLGFQLHVYLRFYLEAPGGPYEWEGELPFSTRRLDLRLFDEQVFDPFLLLGAETSSVMLEDVTAPVRVLQIDFTDAIIPIPKIGGGLQLWISANLVSAFRGQRFEIDYGGPEPRLLVREGQSVLLPVGNGGRLDLLARYLGVMSLDGVLDIQPAVYIQIGKSWHLPLFTVPVTVLDADIPWDFGWQELSFGLPEIEVAVTHVDFGQLPQGQQTSHALTVANYGDLNLEINAVTLGIPFSVSPSELVIPPGGTAEVVVGVTSPGHATAGTLRLVSNDPDEPVVAVGLLVGGADAGVPIAYDDAGRPITPGSSADPPAPGCGCRSASATSTGAAAVLVLLVLGLVARRRS